MKHVFQGPKYSWKRKLEGSFSLEVSNFMDAVTSQRIFGHMRLSYERVADMLRIILET